MRASILNGRTHEFAYFTCIPHLVNISVPSKIVHIYLISPMCSIWHYGLTIIMYSRSSFIWINWNDETFGLSGCHPDVFKDLIQGLHQSNTSNLLVVEFKWATCFDLV